MATVTNSASFPLVNGIITANNTGAIVTGNSRATVDANGALSLNSPANQVMFTIKDSSNLPAFEICAYPQAKANVCIGYAAGQIIDTSVAGWEGNIAIGYEAGKILNIAGYNTCIGWKTGSSLTNAADNTLVGAKTGRFATGGYNTLLGSGVGDTLTSGNTNTLIGSQADVTTGGDDYCIALGYTAKTTASNEAVIGTVNHTFHTRLHGKVTLQQVAADETSGTHRAIFEVLDNSGTKCFQITAFDEASNNLGIGALALDSVTTGLANVSVGSKAGTAITTGNSNLSVGSQANRDITTGTSNVSVGTNAGLLNQTGNSNFCLGTLSGATMTNAFNNVFIGTGAGQYTTGSHNVCIGTSSGVAITTGSSNTMIGLQAGQGASQKVDAVYCIALGRDSYTTIDNQTVIGSTTATSTVLRGTVDVMRSTNPCTLNVYNTASGDPTAGSNYERLAATWSSNVARIGTQAGGTGTARAVAIMTNNTNRLVFNANGTITLPAYASLPTTEPAAGNPGTLWLDASNVRSAILKVTTS